MDQDTLNPSNGPDGEGASNADVCSYSLYLSGSKNVNTAELQALCASILSYASSLCMDPSSGKAYIWQREYFNLTPSEDGKSLNGQTSFGESVEDEWFIVYLLREISKQYNDLVIKIEDNDGQFLLIEAAEVLPNWLNPDNAENRLWISSGELHLIPISHTSPPPPSSSTVESGYLALNDALSLVADLNIDTLAPAEISSAIWSRTAHLPGGIKDQWHTTIAQLPIEIALLLQKDEGMITRAVQAFYERDALQLKACQYMKRFPPSPSKLSSVRMTKALYAQLVSQRFYAPKIFERSGWQTTTSTAEDGQASMTADASTSKTAIRRAEVGMKIACGFEILYSESAAKRRRGTKVNLQRNTEDDQQRHLSQDKSYLKYIVSLTKAGYFQGEIAGSSLYTQLEKRANEYWHEMGSAGSHKDRENIADKIDQLLAEPAIEGSQIEAKDLHEDDESWLYIDEARLEKMLKARQKPTSAPEDDTAMPAASTADANMDESEDEDEKMANEQARKLQDMASKFEGFVEGKGSLEGAMFEDELSEDDDDDEDEEEDDGLNDDLGDIVAGGKTMSAAEKQRRMDKLIPSLKQEEWGAEAAEREKAEKARLAKEAEAPQSGESALSERKDVEMADTEEIAGTEEIDEANTSRASVHSARLASLDKLDGVSDSSDSEDDGRGAPNDPFMGLPASGISRQALVELDDDEDEDDAPQIVADDDEDIQFGEGEMEEFLKFTRDALGLTEEQYSNIVAQREKNGAFVPASSGKAGTATSASGASAPTAKKQAPIEAKATPTPKAQAPTPTSERNAKLDSFEALMDAMDSELQRSKSSTTPSAPAPSFSKSSKPVRKSAEGVVIDDIDSTGDEDDEDHDGDMASLDAELAAALKGGDGMNGEGMDYTMIKNFLESFKSQNGLAGPVSNMFGRLDKDFKMPRDEQ